MILVKISKSLRHLFNIKNKIFPVTFDGLGRRGGGGGGGGKRKGHQVKGAISGFCTYKMSESAKRNRIYSKPLSRVM